MNDEDVPKILVMWTVDVGEQIKAGDLGLCHFEATTDDLIVEFEHWTLSTFEPNAELIGFL